LIAAVDRASLERELRERVDGEIRFDAGTLAAYSTDASNFRQVPIAVVIPRTVEAAVAAVSVCAAHRAPLLSRGGGTSLAGQCTNAAVVIDWTKHCHRVVSVDPERRRCVVEPGIVLDELNRRLAPTGLRYGPEPATHPNCTLGGMIGNNSCGATAQRTGKVVDNTPRLEVLLHDGTRFWCERTGDEQNAAILAQGGRRSEIYRALRELADACQDEIRERFPDIPRRVSGYNLDSLLPEHGFDIAGLLIGSESTLVTVLHAELELVPVIPERTLVVIGYPTVAEAADAVPALTPYDPIALEGMDRRLVRDQELKNEHSEAIEQLPDGNGWLLVQFGGDTAQEAGERARTMLEHLDVDEGRVRFFEDPERQAELWRAREAGLGATAHVPGRRDTWEGWEDSAVPPERLGSYLRDLDALYEDYGYVDDSAPALYGHFGHGCVHTRIPFDLYTDEGVAEYRSFLHEAADLVSRYGGSLSGEHGDGQSRGELLPRMFGDRLVEAFRSVKAIFDPGNLMNPGKVIDPYPVDSNLRLGGGWRPADPGPLHFSFPDDGGSFAKAANRCVGVGRCRSLTTEGGGVMCPSYQVTLEEEHSTRGRARLLFELLNGHADGPIEDGWRSDAVHNALDLCLACKGCKSDCPVNVDMATYKAEFLSHYWEGRLRPRGEYALGWLPALGEVASRLRLTPAINALTQRPRSARLAAAAAGLEHRPLPRLADETFKAWAARRRSSAGSRGEVLLWPDTFTNLMHPHVGRAAVRVLEHAGWGVKVPTQPLCCGLTWISTGQLATGRRVLGRTIQALRDHVSAGGLVVGLEPSCAAVFRADAAELLSDDPDVTQVAQHTVTLAELLTEHTPGWSPPKLGDSVPEAIVQVHCHQHAILGWDADQALLRDCGVDARRLDSGCCGLAGNFGFQPGHLDVSVACAERVMLPAIRDAGPRTQVLADGFSCRTQIEQLDSGGHRPRHLAEVLAAGLDKEAA
jgi:FAD/FMN-containing dehydrogenase/Fe-S oxidoreductase